MIQINILKTFTRANYIQCRKLLKFGDIEERGKGASHKNEYHAHDFNWKCIIDESGPVTLNSGSTNSFKFLIL